MVLNVFFELECFDALPCVHTECFLRSTGVLKAHLLVLSLQNIVAQLSTVFKLPQTVFCSRQTHRTLAYTPQTQSYAQRQVLGYI